MTTIRFSASGLTSATGTFTVSLGGSPSVGDQVVVWLGVSNEIVTHQPGYNAPTQWFQTGALRGRNTSTLSAYQHTWNASDSGSTAVFTVSPAPSLGIGDKDLSSANIVWSAVVLSAPTGASEHLVQGSYDPGGTITPGPIKKAHSMALVASYGLSCSSFTDSDPNSSLVTTVTDGLSCLSLFSVPNPPAGYVDTVSAFTPNNLTLNPNFSTSAPWLAFGGSLSLSTAVDYLNLPNTGLLTPDGVSSSSYLESNHYPGVVGLQSYTATAVVDTPVGHNVAVSINWYDVNGVYISTSNGTSTPVAANTPTQLSTSATAPSSATMGSCIALEPGTPPTSALLYVSQAYLYPTAAPVVPAVTEILLHVSSFNDNPSFVYIAPVLYEGPVAEDALLFRYMMQRHYTVLNNGGAFTAVRYDSTDQLAAASQVFSNNTPVSSNDRTNILNSGVGGEFISA